MEVEVQVQFQLLNFYRGISKQTPFLMFRGRGRVKGEGEGRSDGEKGGWGRVTKSDLNTFYFTCLMLRNCTFNKLLMIRFVLYQVLIHHAESCIISI